MSNPELENFLSCVVTVLSQARCQLAGRAESYIDTPLIQADNYVAQAQLYLRQAVVFLGESRMVADPEIENAMAQLPVGYV